MDMCTIKNETEIGRQIELESHLRKVKACDYYYYDVESKAYMVNPSDSCVGLLNYKTRLINGMY